MADFIIDTIIRPSDRFMTVSMESVSRFSMPSLQNAGGIAQVGKDDAALIAGAGDGAADGHFLTRHGKADFPAVIGTAQAAQSFHISKSPLRFFLL